MIRSPLMVLMVAGGCVAFSVHDSVAQRRVIDMHLHAQTLWASPGSVDSATGIRVPVSTEALRQETIETLRRHNVVLAATSGPTSAAFKAADPDRIMVGLSIDVASATPLDSIRRWYRNGDFQIIGEVATQYIGVAPNSPELAPYFALAEELDIPFGLHMGLGPPGAAYVGSPAYRMSLSNPLLLEDVLIRHPDLRLYVMHAGWPFLDEMIGLLHAHPQVYVDLGIIDWGIPQEEFYYYLRRLVGAGFSDRVMFGSDQMQWPEAIGFAINAIENAPFLTEQQKDDILYNNAARFLRLDGTS